MSDLDRQCAEARGWIVVELVQGPTWDDTDAEGFHSSLLVEDYTPSTDLNQAVKFAEWALEGKLYNYELHLHIGAGCKEKSAHIDNMLNETVSYYAHENLAEAIVEATLEAVKNG